MQTVKSFLFILALLVTPWLHASVENTPKIAIHNRILAKANGESISVLDVVKKMDVIFKTHYPDLADSPSAKYQFFQMSWQRILDDLINTELMQADAESKELKLSDGEVREEIENRYGPNVPKKLDELGLSFEEAFKMVKKEMITQRMSWLFIHAKAFQEVTPEKIKSSYREFCTLHPPKEEWTYQIITLKPLQDNEPSEFFQFLSQEEPSFEQINMHQNDYSEQYHVDMKISNTYSADFHDLAPSYQKVLRTLEKGQYSEPISFTKKNKTTWKIFYLQDKSEDTLPKLGEKYQELSNQLMDQEISKNSSDYIQKLRRHYHYEKLTTPENFEPFSFQ
jgi:hypothetical protein